MGKWYNEAVFYHMYPLGMTGAPKENKEPETVHRLRELFPWIDHLKEIGVTAIYIGCSFISEACDFVLGVRISFDSFSH